MVTVLALITSAGAAFAGPGGSGGAGAVITAPAGTAALRLTGGDRTGTGLLAVVATICLVGTVAAAVRVILAQHTVNRSK